MGSHSAGEKILLDEEMWEYVKECNDGLQDRMIALEREVREMHVRMWKKIYSVHPELVQYQCEVGDGYVKVISKAEVLQ